MLMTLFKLLFLIGLLGILLKAAEVMGDGSLSNP